MIDARPDERSKGFLDFLNRRVRFHAQRLVGLAVLDLCVTALGKMAVASIGSSGRRREPA
jgi:hypothetical protein